MDAINPYEAPRCSAAGPNAGKGADRRGSRPLCIVWPMVLALNLIVPLMFGWWMTEETGRMGLLFAVGVLLSLGWLICTRNRGLGQALVVGSVIMAITQVFPILQVILGLVGMILGSISGQADFGGDSRPWCVTSEFGGFLVTATVGIPLMAGSLCLGLLFQVMTPERWWRRSAEVAEGESLPLSGEHA